VAVRTGRSEDEVVALHSSAEYRVGFCGFMPGFGYLLGLPPELQLPRRSTPRTRVPAGSVAMAAEFSAVYPSASPGGWHLLGTTDLMLWDESRHVPALLVPGTRVRFEAR
jgi:KipI family sensor histidine kinase inhibitor